MQSRISEQKVDDMIKKLHKEVRSEMKIDDGKLMDRIVEL